MGGLCTHPELLMLVVRDSGLRAGEALARPVADGRRALIGKLEDTGEHGVGERSPARCLRTGTEVSALPPKVRHSLRSLHLITPPPPADSRP